MKELSKSPAASTEALYGTTLHHLKRMRITDEKEIMKQLMIGINQGVGSMGDASWVGAKQKRNRFPRFAGRPSSFCSNAGSEQLI